MIERTAISRDEESALYHAAFFRSPTFEAGSVIHRPPPLRPFLSALFCESCCRSGHIASHCCDRLPSLEELEDAVDRDLAEVLSNLVGTRAFMRDDFGLYEIDTSNRGPIPCTIEKDGKTEPLNWGSEKFCLNCGRAGHISADCPEEQSPHNLHAMDPLFESQRVPNGQQPRRGCQRV
jgi:hypothetical protein